MPFDVRGQWYRDSLTPVTGLLLPFSWLFACLVALRRWFYRFPVFTAKPFSVPVIVVGNISVGGTGKTPFVIWLAQLLKEQGYRPGIVSRGYSGKKHPEPHVVRATDSAVQVGDETLLLLQNTDCPVVICTKRSAAVTTLLQNFNCDVVISDDGLQHYKLHRDIEIAIVDGELHFGNRQLLPAGPLRESPKRLKTVDITVVNGGVESTMQLESVEMVSLLSPEQKLAFTAIKKVHALAGIGHPQRFFNLLRAAGLEVIEHPFADHYQFKANDLNFNDSLAILMTEKDAVKCQKFANERCWYLKVQAKVENQVANQIIKKLQSWKENQHEKNY